jgi:hypothetical protein
MIKAVRKFLHKLSGLFKINDEVFFVQMSNGHWLMYVDQFLKFSNEPTLYTEDAAVAIVARLKAVVKQDTQRRDHLVRYAAGRTITVTLVSHRDTTDRTSHVLISKRLINKLKGQNNGTASK